MEETKGENNIMIDLNDIDFQEMKNHLVLGENGPKLDFLDNKGGRCGDNAHFYCNDDSQYICQKGRNKEHHPGMKRNMVENIREFKQELEFDLNYFHKEIKRFWLICQCIGIDTYNKWIYDMSESYEKWIANLKEIAEKKELNLIDKILSITELK